MQTPIPDYPRLPCEESSKLTLQKPYLGGIHLIVAPSTTWWLLGLGSVFIGMFSAFQYFNIFSSQEKKMVASIVNQVSIHRLNNMCLKTTKNMAQRRGNMFEIKIEIFQEYVKIKDLSYMEEF